MALRSNGPMAGFGWLTRAINLGHRNARAVFGGAAFVVLAALLPTLVTLPVQFGTLRAGVQPSGTTMLLLMAISMIAGLLLVPLYVGYLRVIDAAETGRPSRARDVFAAYRQGEVLRFVGYGLAMMAVYIAAFAAVLVAVGGGLVRWYMQVLALQQSGQATVPPTLPSGIGLAILLLCVLCVWLMGVYAISLGQVALRGRSVLGAIGDGVIGSVKNVLPLLVFSVSLIVAWVVIAIVVGLAFAAAALLGKVIGVWLTVVLAVLLYIALILAMFVVMFGAMYHLWRDVCGDDVASPDMGEFIAA
jgi:hypothetical protein